MRNREPLTTAEHITNAKDVLASGGSTDYAVAHALVAIAELLQTNIAETFIEGAKTGSLATAEALGKVLDITGVMPSGDQKR